MRRGTLVLLALLSGCNGTGSSPIANGPEPDGWIYYALANDELNRIWRINLGTAEIERITFPPPYDTSRAFPIFGREISPTTGQITGLSFVGGSAPENFIYYAVGDSIKVIRFAPANQFSISRGFRMRWSPDGLKIAFKLEQLNCCDRLAVLHPATGELDTLLGPNASSNMFFWLGPDTLVFGDKSLPDYPLKSIDLTTRRTAPWNVVEAATVHDPVASANGRWVAHWRSIDSAAAGGEVKYFWSLQLFDRSNQTDTTLVVDHSDFDGRIFPEVTFEPDNRFVAYCTSQTTITILELDHRRGSRTLEVPECYNLAWSWGEGGSDSGS